MKTIEIRRHAITIRLAILAAILLVATAEAQAQGGNGRLRIDYTVEVKSLDDKLFQVTADVKNIRQSSVDLSLPVWTPGW
ncbi:MAG TPA: hypothetical protein VLD57_04640, partial [Blastocatellia bacterium]|nr:hypothetical protein [Blastocatellia bacterium]